MLYKVLSDDGTPHHGGIGAWHLPKGKRPGKWMPAIPDIEPCKRGYHLCRPQDLWEWLGPAIFEAEGKGERIECHDKVVYPQARLVRRCTAWTERNARLFAADCAEHVVQFVPKARRQPCVDAIATARRYAHGYATDAELDAARDAARDASMASAKGGTGYASRDAAMVSARDAALAAAKAATGYASWAAAKDAARDASMASAMASTWGAPRDTTRVAEQTWQQERLMALLKPAGE